MTSHLKISRLLPCLLAVVAIAAAGVGATANAADPNAPQGAPPTWLPDTTWVMEHWLPYKESTLYATLHTSRDGVLNWLRAHHDDPDYPLLALARANHVPTQGLAKRLVGPRPHGMSTQTYALLLSRAQDTLTQAHLMHHMLGHLFHVVSLQHAMPTLLKMSWAEIDELLYGYGWSIAQIAQRQGIDPTSLSHQLFGILQATQREAIALHQTPRAQAAYWLSLQRQAFHGWFDTGQPVNTAYLTLNAVPAGYVNP